MWRRFFSATLGPVVVVTGNARIDGHIFGKETTLILQRSIALVLCFALAGCSLPRGAGFQAEVLDAKDARTDDGTGEPTYDFTVYEVNRSTLPVLRQWTGNGVETFPWLGREEQPASLLIAPGDLVQLTIWDAEENSLLAGAGQRVTPLQETQVSPSGEIFVPFIGDLVVAGLPSDVARAKIESELTRTIPSAQVQMVIEPGLENSVNVVSGVGAPGFHALPHRNFKLLDFLSLAGGVSADLPNPQVRLIRGGRTYGIPYSQLLENPALDTTMRGGDRIMVLKDDRKFLSLGATGSQTVHDFPDGDVTALEALAIIGGVNSGNADPKGILVMREYNASDVRDGISGPPQERVVFTLDLTSADGLFSAGKFLLRDGDLVYGTESVIVPALNALSLARSLVSLAN
jgi:polysaccharide export outer membrane protein